MDSYLEIAQKVLRAAKRPMTPKAILDAAYKAKIVPEYLYGKTQHKTLQARLSEDILHRRAQSTFFRTEPGLFFLSEFISNPDIPEKFKVPFPARRRTRDLSKGYALCLKLNFLKSVESFGPLPWHRLAEKAENADAILYADPQSDSVDCATVQTFTVVKRGHTCLSYRIGRYRDDRDNFANKRSIGFRNTVTAEDSTLFSDEKYGVQENALNAVLQDLDLSISAFSIKSGLEAPELKSCQLVENNDQKFVFLIIFEWHCPPWFEPTTRRLSINDPHWLDLSNKVNNLNDFEDWSKRALELIS